MVIEKQNVINNFKYIIRISKNSYTYSVFFGFKIISSIGIFIKFSLALIFFSGSIEIWVLDSLSMLPSYNSFHKNIKLQTKYTMGFSGFQN